MQEKYSEALKVLTVHAVRRLSVRKFGLRMMKMHLLKISKNVVANVTDVP